MRKRPKKRSAWWTGNVRSVDVTESLRLVPYWEAFQAEPDRVNVIIDPGPAFGAGDHPSTVMALELLEIAMGELNEQGMNRPTVLDVGTGTGVLGIAAKKLGSGFTVGFDIDSAAICTARRNLELNGLSCTDPHGHAGMELFVGELGCIHRCFDLVAANLAAPVLKRLAGTLAPVVGSMLVLSGIADAMIALVQQAYLSRGFLLGRHLSLDGWNALLLRGVSQNENCR